MSTVEQPVIAQAQQGERFRATVHTRARFHWVRLARYVAHVGVVTLGRSGVWLQEDDSPDPDSPVLLPWRVVESVVAHGAAIDPALARQSPDDDETVSATATAERWSET
jgi:hypothetical protein